MPADDFKCYGSIFRQTEEELKDYLQRSGRQYNPASEYPAYLGNIQVPVEAVPDLIDYLTNADPIYDRNGQNPAIKLSVKGWVKKTKGGKAYQSLSVEPDYRTAQKLVNLKPVQPQRQSQRPAPRPQIPEDPF